MNKFILIILFIINTANASTQTNNPSGANLYQKMILRPINNVPVSFIKFRETLIQKLFDKDSKFLTSFSNLGVSFLVNFIKRTNLEALLRESLHGDIHFLDDFYKVSSFNKHSFVFA